MPFVCLELVQGTDEWLRWRAGGIGASEAATMLGVNPWRSAGELMQDKLMVRLASRQNAAMEMGTRLEPVARSAYCVQTGRRVEPACLQSTGYPWLRASVDGIDKTNKYVVEIKCGQSAYRKATGGVVPDYYHWQLQHILAVTGYDEIDYYAYWLDCKPILMRVRRNKRSIDAILKEAEALWSLIGADVERRLSLLNG